MIKIKIYKNDKGIVCYSMNSNEFLFAYESFEKLIDSFLSGDDEYEIDCTEEFEEYKKLLDGIIKGVKTEDFRNAVKAAEESKRNLEELENVNNI